MDSQALRQRAIHIQRERHPSIPQTTLTDLTQLVEELQIHQIELEIQNQELRETQEALERAHKRYFDLFHMAPVGYVVVDRQGHIQNANLMACTLLGHEHKYVLMRSLVLYCQPAYREQYYAHLRASFESDEPQTIELAIVPRNSPDQRRIVTVVSEPHYINDLRFARMIITDITAQKEAEHLLRDTNLELERRVQERTRELSEANHQLRTEIDFRQKAEMQLYESEQFLQRVINGQTSHIAVIDTDGTIMMVNEAWRRFGRENGASAEVIQGIGLNYLEMCADTPEPHRTDCTQITKAIRDVLVGGRNTFAYEYACHSPNEKRWFTLHISRFEHNWQPRLLLTHTNITQQKQLERDIRNALQHERELGKMKSRFLSVVSHEFRTPLTVMRSSAGLLDEFGDQMNRERRSQHVGRINEQIVRLVAMLDDLTILNKNEITGHELMPTQLDMEQFMFKTVNEIAEAYSNNVTVEFAAHNHDEHWMYTDETLLYRIFSNLISNAVKYSRPNSAVIMGCERFTDHVRVSIADQGYGIPDADQKHIFEMFHRAENVKTIQGTGLGLVIAKQAVERLGGSISFISDEGVGTTFFVELPLDCRPADARD